MDRRAREKAKQLNAVRYEREQKQARIHEMNRILERMDMIAVNGDAKFVKYDMQVWVVNFIHLISTVMSDLGS